MVRIDESFQRATNFLKKYIPSIATDSGRTIGSVRNPIIRNGYTEAASPAMIRTGAGSACLLFRNRIR